MRANLRYQEITSLASESLILGHVFGKNFKLILCPEKCSHIFRDL